MKTFEMFAIIVVIILAVFSSYWGLSNNLNQRLDTIKADISDSNREIGEIKKDVKGLNGEIEEVIKEMETGFANIDIKLKNIEKMINALKI
jgi:septal ring factor EnvC (AmiA/AmiB activator)